MNTNPAPRNRREPAKPQSNWRIIGSVAIKHHFLDFRIPDDIDLLTPAKVTGNHSTTCVVDAQWHDMAQEMIDQNVDPVYLDANALYTLKVSHAEWPVKWDKTMSDIAFLRSKGCVLDVPLYEKLKPIWREIHGKKKVNMNQTVDVFFARDAVRRDYDHEELHRLVAFYDAPLHERLHPTPDSVWCSRDKWDALGLEDQLKCACEEVMAVAIERARLTSDSPNSARCIAMSNSIKQLITSMTTGYFALFLIEHRIDILFRMPWKPQVERALGKLNTLEKSQHAK